MEKCLFQVLASLVLLGPIIRVQGSPQYGEDEDPGDAGTDPGPMGRAVKRQKNYVLPKWGDREQLLAIISQRDKSWSTLINNVAPFRKSDPKPSLQMVLRDMNLLMRESYKNFMDRVGKNLYPLIIASDYETGFAGVGSTFKLFLADGTTKHIAPVPGSYERNKALAHIPLALFTLVSSHFNYPTGTGWRGNLLRYQEKLKDAMVVMKAAKPSDPDDGDDVTQEEITRGKKMLTLSIAYTENCLKTNNVNQRDFIKYTEKMVPLLEEAMKSASEVQVNHVYPALKAWKEEMGEEEWDKVYVIIPTVWPVADINPREQIIAKLMKPDKVKTNLLKVENSSGDDFSRATLGRVIGDRSMSHIIWGVRTPSAIDHLLSLSTRRDLVSTSCEYSLKQLLEGEER